MREFVVSEGPQAPRRLFAAAPAAIQGGRGRIDVELLDHLGFEVATGTKKRVG